MTQIYKLVFTVPIAAADDVRRAIGDAGAGLIGNYSHCSFSVRGVGRFVPLPGAEPAIGSIGVPEEVEEERVECQCSEAVLDAVLDALKNAHPYEEVAYDVWKLESR